MSSGFVERPLASDVLSPQAAFIGFAAITGTTPGTANTLITNNNTRRLMTVTNGTDKILQLAIGGLAGPMIANGATLVLPLGGNGLIINATQVVAVYQTADGAPTSGSLTLSVM